MNLEKEEQEKVTFEGSSLVTKTASIEKYIPNEVYINLPEPLNQIANQFEGREKDIILLSSLGVLSACMPNVTGLYDEREFNPNLYLFIIAPPASGKGVMDWSKHLILPIHRAKYLEYKRRLQEYQRNENQNEIIEKPELISKVIPGNVSSSKCYYHLNHSEDSVLIFESEADSLSNMLKQDWGDFSDLMRKSFQHETCSISRNDRFFEVEKPKLSLVLSGTPNQLKPLISSKENGLFSRFLFYYFDEVRGWKDVSPKRRIINKTEFFERKGEQIKILYDRLLNMDKVEIVMNEVQWSRFNETMRSINDIFLKDKNDFTSTTKRLGLIAFRLIMILTVLRNFSKIQGSSIIIPVSDMDLVSILSLVKYLVDHSLYVYDKYEAKSKKMTLQDRLLYRELPNEFRRSSGVEVAKEFDIPERTFAEILNRWQELNILEKVSHGKYRKLTI